MVELFIKVVSGVIITMVLLAPVVQYYVLVINILLRDITKAGVRKYCLPFIGAVVWLLDYYKELEDE